jgi:hypothetical protein
MIGLCSKVAIASGSARRPKQARHRHRFGSSLIAGTAITLCLSALVEAPALATTPSTIDTTVDSVTNDTTPDIDTTVSEIDSTTATTTTGGTDEPFDPVGWWQWLLAAVLVVGAISVIVRSGRRPPDPRITAGDALALLAQYQEIAAVAVGSGDRHTYAYELGVLGALAPRLDELIVSASDQAQKGALMAVKSHAEALVVSMRPAESSRSIEAQVKVTEAGARLAGAVERARSAF